MFNPDTAPQLPEQNRLVFRQYGNRYFLANLWTAGSRTGLRMVKSRTEKQMLESMSRPPSTASGLEVAVVETH